ncbi:MAG TPA: HupE/UreJ family protein [Caulifigura sp.]|nr:HupE/UreJ family protein [Caulifigura sp.]
MIHLVLRFLVAISALLASVSSAVAHPEGFSGLAVTIEPQSIRASLTLHTRDFDRWFPAGKYKNYVNDVCRELERTVDEIVDVQVNGVALKRQGVTARQIEVGLLELDVRWAPPKFDRDVELLVWSKHLLLMPRDHQQLLFVDDRRKVFGTEKAGTVLLEDILTVDRDAAAVEIPDAAESPAAPASHSASGETPAEPTVMPATVSAGRAPRRGEPGASSHASGISFFLLGIEHILTGYDHLLFLTALLLTCSSLREAAAIITCFTIAHSVTLALAALDVVSLPGKIVEPAIAASIVYVAVENLWTKPVVWRRAVITFVFGLVHGLGFASVLKEIGLGRLPGGVVWPLVRFNLGVETGQLAVAAALLPVLTLVRRSKRLREGAVVIGSVAIAVCGAYWLVVRVFCS